MDRFSVDNRRVLQDVVLDWVRYAIRHRRELGMSGYVQRSEGVDLRLSLDASFSSLEFNVLESERESGCSKRLYSVRALRGFSRLKRNEPGSRVYCSEPEFSLSFMTKLYINSHSKLGVVQYRRLFDFLTDAYAPMADARLLRIVRHLAVVHDTLEGYVSRQKEVRAV